MVEHSRTPGALVGRVFPWLQADVRGQWFRVFEEDGRVAASLWIADREARLLKLLIARARRSALTQGRYDITVRRTRAGRNAARVMCATFVAIYAFLAWTISPHVASAIRVLQYSPTMVMDVAVYLLAAAAIVLVLVLNAAFWRQLALDNVASLRVRPAGYDIALFDGRAAHGPLSDITLSGKGLIYGKSAQGVRFWGEAERASFCLARPVAHKGPGQLRRTLVILGIGLFVCGQCLGVSGVYSTLVGLTPERSLWGAYLSGAIGIPLLFVIPLGAYFVCVKYLPGAGRKRAKTRRR